MELQIKNQVVSFFKLSGYQIRSDVAMLLVTQIKELSENERKQMIDKIFTSIQNQAMESTNIEEHNMLTAIRVRNSLLKVLIVSIYTNFLRRNVRPDISRNRKQFLVSSMLSMFLHFNIIRKRKSLSQNLTNEICWHQQCQDQSSFEAVMTLFFRGSYDMNSSLHRSTRTSEPETKMQKSFN